MVDWESNTWGNTVHLAANGSWASGQRPRDNDVQDSRAASLHPDDRPTDQRRR